MPAQIAITRLTTSAKIGEAIRHSLPHIPSNVQRTVNILLQPQTLSVIAGTLIFWVGSHAFGIGEIVDIILLGIGAVSLGFAVFEGADELYKFATGAISANCEDDLEKAGKHFARAVILLGISTLQAILLKGQGKAVITRGRPQIYPRPNVGFPPTKGSQLNISRPGQLAEGSLGGTDAYGAITIA